MANAINWFELPSTNFDRAVKFYEEVLGSDLQRMDFDGTQMGFFPSSDQGVGGAVVHGNGATPNADGALVYLNGGDDLSIPLSRVEAAGGSVVLPKTSIGEHGFIGMFMDSEGNRVGFHSNG